MTKKDLHTPTEGRWNHYRPRRLRVSGVALLSRCAEGRDARVTWKCSVWLFIPHWSQMQELHSPQCAPPWGWHVWFSEIHEDRYNGPPICARPYLNDDSHRQGGHWPGDAVNGKTRKTYRSVEPLCANVCDCLCSWLGGEDAFTWGCFVEHIICNLSFKSSGGGELSVLSGSNNQ